jgi:hypothetical protein
MKIRIDGVKGINLEQYIGKRLVLKGSDIENGKFYEITVDVFDKRTTYLVMEETEKPVEKARRKGNRRQINADAQE